MRIPLGALATDIVTGFQGRVTGRVEYLTGCNQYLLTGKSVDNKEPGSSWFDESRVAQIEEGGVLVLPTAAPDGTAFANGPDRPAPIR